MSHFALIVCLDKAVDLSVDEKGHVNGLSFALDQALERFDEGKEIEPRRDYVTGSPEDWWFVTVARRLRDEYVNGTGIKRYEPGFLGYGSHVSGKTEAEQRAEQEQWKMYADLLDQVAAAIGRPIGWLEVFGTYLAYVSSPDSDDRQEYFYDENEDKIYAITTYNEQSRWDWWAIGGRYAGKFYRTADADPTQVFDAEGGRWNSPEYESWDGRVDGGRKRYLDLDRKRDEAGAEARERHRRYHALVAEHGESYVPWSTWVNRVDAEELTIHEARELYREQPLRRVIQADEEFKYWWGDLDEELGVPEDEYVTAQRRTCTTGYAMLTKAGVWMEPGRMGWFGMSDDTPSSREAYDVEANVYLDSLDPDDIVVVIDCHI